MVCYSVRAVIRGFGLDNKMEKEYHLLNSMVFNGQHVPRCTFQNLLLKQRNVMVKGCCRSQLQILNSSCFIPFFIILLIFFSTVLSLFFQLYKLSVLTMSWRLLFTIFNPGLLNDKIDRLLQYALFNSAFFSSVTHKLKWIRLETTSMYSKLEMISK